MLLELFFPYICKAETADYELKYNELERSDVKFMLVDLDYGQILLSREKSESIGCSLLSRLMSSLIILENYSLTDKITSGGKTSSDDGNYIIEKNYSYTVASLLHTAIMGNAGNASELLYSNFSQISGISGVDAMNRRAEKLGMKNTYFTSVSGNSDGISKTTPEDFVTFIKAALDNDEFKNIFCSPYISGLDGEIINNPNKIVLENSDATIGGLQFSDGSSVTTVYFYSKDEGNDETSCNYILITDSNFAENSAELQKIIINYCFSHYSKQKLAKAGYAETSVVLGNKKVNYVTDKDIYVYFPNNDENILGSTSFSYLENRGPEDIKAPLNRGECVGTVTYNLNDGTKITANLYSQISVLSANKIVDKAETLIKEYPGFFVGVGALCVVLIVMVVYEIWKGKYQ